MIQNKQDYYAYLAADSAANGWNHDWTRFLKIQYWYLRRLRKTEYLLNCNKKLRYMFSRLLLVKTGEKAGWTIPANVFGKGLMVPHYGTIIVNKSARFGENCVVQCGVNVSEGASGGNHIYFAAGCKVMKNVHIADDVIIGANAVVTKDVLEPDVVIGGIPAKIISHNGYASRTERI